MRAQCHIAAHCMAMKIIARANSKHYYWDDQKDGEDGKIILSARTTQWHIFSRAVVTLYLYTFHGNSLSVLPMEPDGPMKPDGTRRPDRLTTRTIETADQHGGGGDESDHKLSLNYVALGHTGGPNGATICRTGDVI